MTTTRFFHNKIDFEHEIVCLCMLLVLSFSFLGACCFYSSAGLKYFPLSNSLEMEIVALESKYIS